MLGVEDGGEHVLGPLPQPGELLGVHPSHPGRGVDEAVPIRILADGDQYLADRPLDPLLIDGRLPIDGCQLGRELLSRRLIQRGVLRRRLFG